MSKEASGDLDAVYKGWIKCGNCKQGLAGALGLEMKRRSWRHYRSRQDLALRYNSTRSLATYIGLKDELHAANQLLDEASTWLGNNTGFRLDLKLQRVSMLIKLGRNLEALGHLQAVLPEAKVYLANPLIYGQALQELVYVFLHLHRNQEAHETATELVTFTKANYSPETPVTLTAVRTYALACAHVGRVEEAKANFEDVLTIETRVLGRDHPERQVTINLMHIHGFDVPSG